MALTFTKKPKTPTEFKKEKEKKTPVKTAKKPVAPPTKSAKAQVSEAIGGTPAWFKKGDAVQGAIEEEDKRIERKKEEAGKMWRFYMKEGETRRITFVDGALTKNGILDVFAYREHHLHIGGSWKHWYPCTAEQEPCPLCEAGNEPSLVGVLTIIDHTKGKSKKGKEFKDTVRLFVAKRRTLKLLQSLAAMSKGLVGCTFDVTRSGGDNSANVGDEFKFIEKNDPKVLQKRYVRKDEKTGKVETLFKVADYTKEITYHTASELRKMGFGAAGTIGGEGELTDDDVSGVDEELE